MEATSQETNETISQPFHQLNCTWTLWAHLPHDTNWSLESYIKILTFNHVEDIIALIETLPEALVENCMLFLMRDGIKPTWEDPKNRKGGCFSYKVMNKSVYDAWKDLCFSIAGETVSKNISFVDNVCGCTISPKKKFCIIKIWMTNCVHQNPGIVNNNMRGIVEQGCIFKAHTPEY
jgi:hypothetical protein